MGDQYDPPSMFFLKFLENSQRCHAGSPGLLVLVYLTRFWRILALIHAPVSFYDVRVTMTHLKSHILKSSK